MLTEQYLILLSKREDFTNFLSEIRSGLGIPEDVKNEVSFNDWNKYFSQQSTLSLLTPGTVFEGDMNDLESLSTEALKVNKQDLDNSYIKIAKKFNLPSEAKDEIVFLIITNRLSQRLNFSKNYNAYLIQDNGIWRLCLEITGSTRRRDIEWKKSIKNLVKLYKTLPHHNLSDKYVVTVTGDGNILVELSDNCRLDDINWSIDIAPLQKGLISYKGKKRPVDLEDYRLLQKRAKNKRKLRNIAYEKVGYGPDSGSQARKEQKRLKSKLSRYNKHFQ